VIIIFEGKRIVMHRVSIVAVVITMCMHLSLLYVTSCTLYCCVCVIFLNHYKTVSKDTKYLIAFCLSVIAVNQQSRSRSF